MSIIAGQHEGAANPVAGWYADPNGSGQRWWDGTAWTDHVQAAPVAAPASGNYPATVYTPADRFPYGDAGTYGTPAESTLNGAPSAYGTPGTYGAPSAYGAPGVYGGSGMNGAPGAYGASTAYGTVSANPVPKNTQALVGFIIGVVAVTIGVVAGIWFGSFLAILLSANGLKKADQLRSAGYAPVGRAMAIWGIVLGCLSLVVSLILRLSAA
jgi:Protein of unknown function (DUF2510)